MVLFSAHQGFRIAACMSKLWNAQDPRQVAARAAVAASPQAATVAAAAPAPAPSPEEDSAEEEEDDEEAPAPAPSSGPASPGSPTPAVGPSMDGAAAPNNTATCSITLDSPPTTTVTCEPVLLKVGALAARRSTTYYSLCLCCANVQCKGLGRQTKKNCCGSRGATGKLQSKIRCPGKSYGLSAHEKLPSWKERPCELLNSLRYAGNQSILHSNSLCRVEKLFLHCKHATRMAWACAPC
jgi:hypothetical protein